jgi:hypothetical protein
MKSILSKGAMKNHTRYAKDAFKRNGAVEPLLIMNLGDVVIPMAVGRLFNNYDKRFVMSIMPDFIREKHGGRKIKEAVLIFEAWYVQGDEDGKDAIDRGIMPSEHPERKEGILIIGRNRKRTKCPVDTYTIDREDGDKLKRNELTESDAMVGIMDYLFDVDDAKLREHGAYEKKTKN